MTNEYGQRIQATWTRLKPHEVEQMSDPEAFFTAKGEEVLDLIAVRTQELADQEPQAQTYTAEVRRLKTLRMEAESQVMREKLDEWLPPHLEQPGL